MEIFCRTHFTSIWNSSPTWELWFEWENMKRKNSLEGWRRRVTTTNSENMERSEIIAVRRQEGKENLEICFLVPHNFLAFETWFPLLLRLLIANILIGISKYARGKMRPKLFSDRRILKISRIFFIVWPKRISGKFKCLQFATMTELMRIKCNLFGLLPEFFAILSAISSPFIAHLLLWSSPCVFSFFFLVLSFTFRWLSELILYFMRFLARLKGDYYFSFLFFRTFFASMLTRRLANEPATHIRTSWWRRWWRNCWEWCKNCQRRRGKENYFAHIFDRIFHFVVVVLDHGQNNFSTNRVSGREWKKQTQHITHFACCCLVFREINRS